MGGLVGFQFSDTGPGELTVSTREDGAGGFSINLPPGKYIFRDPGRAVQLIYWMRKGAGHSTSFHYLLAAAAVPGEGGYAELTALLVGETPLPEELSERWAELQAARFDTCVGNVEMERLARVMRKAVEGAWGGPVRAP